MAGEEVKFTSNPVKKRNVVQTSHASHNVGHSSAISNRQHVPQVQSQALLEKGGIESDDEDFEEPPEQRAILKSLANLPGITASDSMSYRIEALRVHLENQMGDAMFIAAYKHLINLKDDDEQADNALEGMLKKKMKFVPLIH